MNQVTEPGCEPWDWYLFYIKREPNPLVRLLFLHLSFSLAKRFTLHYSLFTSEAFHYSLRSKSDWSMSHTRGCGDGRQEGCESGYYDLHRYLNNSIRLHNFHFSLFTVHYSLFSSVPGRHCRSCLRCHHWCSCYRPGSGYRHSP